MTMFVQMPPAADFAPLRRTAAPLVQRAADSKKTQAADPPASAQTAAGTLIVDDEAKDVAAGQMRKSAFLDLLRSSVCSTADAELAAVGRSTQGCPYVERWIAHYRTQDARHVERALRKYAPETAGARSAREYIPLVAERVRRAVRKWATTGEVTDIPEEMKGEIPGGGLAGVIGGAMGAFGGAVAGAISRIFTKARPGGARNMGDPAGVQAQLSAGAPLEGGIRTRMERAFAHDFSRVRVHTDTRAARLSDGLNARAFTVGRDVAFGSGEYRPGTPFGDVLIAHELAHVVQQGERRDRMPGPPTAALEEDADSAAWGAMASIWRGGRGGVPRLRSGLQLQRCSKPRTTPASQAEADTWIQGKFGRNVAKAVQEGRTASASVFHYADEKEFCDALQKSNDYKKKSGKPVQEDPCEIYLGFVDERFSNPKHVWISRKRQKADTAVHESLHVYSDPSFPEKMSNVVNEGTTEYFARQIAKAQNLEIEGSYDKRVEQIAVLTDKTGDEALVQAYFHGKIQELKSAVNSSRPAATFEAWRCEMQLRNFEEAAALIRGEAADVTIRPLCKSVLPPI